MDRDADRIRARAEARDAIPAIPMRRDYRARAGVGRAPYPHPWNVIDLM